ncbi:MAG: hypothetical protein M3389_04110, partial [Actinomycetota bacterium]|nr:hypothetical protein [Actinomycetota bacterium]
MTRFNAMRCALPATAAAAVVIGTLGAPASAQASADGCTGAPNGYVCVQVEGESRYVERLGAVRGKANWSGICDYRAKVVVRAPSGRKWRYWSPWHRGCSYGRAWFDWYPRRNFPHESRVCATFYEDGTRRRRGKRQGGVPCVTILR